ncbi:MAG: ELM1/GtrOC1 family putative glycosyltransferase [Pseudomonadota bacterium]
MPEPLVIWRLTDGKPGHMQQTLGLAQALSRRVACACHDIDLREHASGWLDVLRGRFPAGAGLPRPGLVIGAGHGTHLALLAARRATGARAVALMKPSLPLALFDLVIAPAHDGLAESARVINTLGVLNPMQGGEKQSGSLLVLIGGPSKHVRWDDATVLHQVAEVAAAQPPSSDWQLTDSRRTPAALGAELQRRYGARFQPWAACPPGWLAARLAVTESVWVSEDSVSMVYESLTAGCRVGLLQLEANRSGRVARGVEQLLGGGRVTSFADWSMHHVLPPQAAFNEAERIAPLVIERLLPR